MRDSRKPEEPQLTNAAFRISPIAGALLGMGSANYLSILKYAQMGLIACATPAAGRWIAARMTEAQGEGRVISEITHHHSRLGDVVAGIRKSHADSFENRRAGLRSRDQGSCR